MIEEKAYAKLNLTLEVTGKRADGYHLLRMVMQSVSLFDTVLLNFNSTGEITVRCDAKNVPADQSNTAYRAAAIFFEMSRIKNAGVDIFLEKRIPSMAGLGGGSSDAAAVLRALNAHFGNILSREMLLNAANRVGADVPFCLFGRTALAEGTGEILTEMPPLREGCFVIVKPETGISTAEAFRRFDVLASAEDGHRSEKMAELIRSGSTKGLGGLLYNDLERAVLSEEMEKLKTTLSAFGAQGALMTGSGSAIFGFFEEEKAAEICFSGLLNSGLCVFLCTPV